MPEMVSDAVRNTGRKPVRDSIGPFDLCTRFKCFPTAARHVAGEVQLESFEFTPSQPPMQPMPPPGDIIHPTSSSPPHPPPDRGDLPLMSTSSSHLTIPPTSLCASFMGAAATNCLSIRDISRPQQHTRPFRRRRNSILTGPCALSLREGTAWHQVPS